MVVVGVKTWTVISGIWAFLVGLVGGRVWWQRGKMGLGVIAAPTGHHTEWGAHSVPTLTGLCCHVFVYTCETGSAVC